MDAIKKQHFFAFSGIEMSLQLPSFKVRGLQMTINFPLV